MTFSPHAVGALLSRTLGLAALFSLGCGGSETTTDAGVHRDASDIADAGAPADTGTGTDSGPPFDGGTVSDAGTADPLAGARERCVVEINRLRATQSLTPYSRWTGVDMCLDSQATADESSGTPHGAWSGGTFAECNGNAQNECLGAGVAGIESCLQQMWNERDQPGCAGCDACADAYDPSCPNCDFLGRDTGVVCGHYVNMSARYFTEAGCGFNAAGGWAVINFR